MIKPIRVDKWLWAVRIYKTRSQATDECRKGRVVVNGIPVKPSHIVKPGEIILLRKPPAIYSYKVKGIIEKRVSAQVARKYVENITTNEEIAKLETSQLNVNFRRNRGTGRPTKKDRRLIDKIKEW
jgi:ribosome-associated heat shock protein Hsp15